MPISLNNSGYSSWNNINKMRANFICNKSTLPKLKRLKTKTMGSENVGLNYKQDFIEAFKKNIVFANPL